MYNADLIIETQELIFMRLMRWFGVGIIIIGILLILDFSSNNINPNVNLGNYGLIALLLGCLVIGADAFSRRVNLSQSAANLSVVIAAGWTTLSSGLLVALLGFLLENQVMCSCPASGPCACGVCFTVSCSTPGYQPL